MLRTRQWDKSQFSRRATPLATASTSQAVPVSAAAPEHGSEASSAVAHSLDNFRDTAVLSLSHVESRVESVETATAVVPKLTSVLFDASNGKHEAVHTKDSVHRPDSAEHRVEAASHVQDEQEQEIQRELQEGMQEFKAGRIECRWSDWSELVGFLLQALSPALHLPSTSFACLRVPSSP